ncbi:MAG: hypothetical protein EA392_03175 [Cryomorphaceae bacterium]|nr:MAG: hypothetical protein EA392_03175 [Cryomorphaceae bacterium]
MKKAVLFFAMAAIAVACSKDRDEVLNPQSGVSTPVAKSMALPPVVITGENPGGNVTCEEAGDYSLSSGKIDYEGGVFEGEWPAGFDVSTDGIHVNWSYTDPDGELCIGDMAVIVKGGPSAHVYYYPEGGSSDAGITAPINPNTGTPYGLSNLTFCYDLVPCDDEDDPCYQDETAWADGPRYRPKGNWATYTPYEAGDVILYAGQHHNAGTVNLSEVMGGMVTITITLNEGFMLNTEKSESVKIQGYMNTPPSNNPAPGLFNTYKGDQLMVTVSAFNFYGIHLDLLREVDCD